MNKTKIYGHKQLNYFFRPLISVTDSGFIFRKKRYTWNDIETFDHWCPRSGMAKILSEHSGISPSATIILKNGEKIKLNARVLEKKGKKDRADFFNGKTNAFEELLHIIIDKAPVEALSPACRAFYKKTPRIEPSVSLPVGNTVASMGIVPPKV